MPATKAFVIVVVVRFFYHRFSNYVCQSVFQWVRQTVSQLVSCVKYLTKWPKQTHISRQSLQWFHGQTVCVCVCLSYVVIVEHSSFMLFSLRSGNANARNRAQFVVCVLSTKLVLGCCDVVTGLLLVKSHTYTHTSCVYVLIWQFFKCWHWPTYRLSTLSVSSSPHLPLGNNNSTVKCGQ